MVEQPVPRGTLLAAGAVLAIFLATPASALAATAFSGVAAGDMTSNDVILWTRTFDPTTGRPLATAVTAQLAAEPEFSKIIFRLPRQDKSGARRHTEDRCDGARRPYPLFLSFCCRRWRGQPDRPVRHRAARQ
jgi:phosphodiesterase/alkaline phosphatase D-like protein